MPRVRYVDEQSHEGELDLAHVRVGDLIRFVADYHKIAGPSGAIDIKKGEIGEVHEVGPETMKISVSAQRTAAGDHFLEDCVVDADFDAVAVVVDSRDPRIGSNRISDDQRLATWELELCIHDARAAGVDPFDRLMVAAELVRQGFRRRRAMAGSAARLALSAVPVAWQTFLLSIGLRRAQVDPAGQAREDAQANVMMGPALYRSVNWAITAMSAEFAAMHGRAPDIRNKEDVAWALGALVADLNLSLPREIYTDSAAQPELANAKQTAQKLMKAQQDLAGMSPEAWVSVVDEMTRPFTSPPPEPVDAEPRYLPPVKMEDPIDSARYVDDVASEDNTPAVDTDPENALPIRLPPGAGQGRIYADAGMGVYSMSKKMPGEVLGTSTTSPDGVVVRTDTGTETWDAMDVVVNHKWTGPKRFVPAPIFDAWLKLRRQRARGHKACYEIEYVGSDPHREDGASNGLRSASRDPEKSWSYNPGGDQRRGPDRGDRTGWPAPRETDRSGHNLGLLVDGEPDDNGHRTALIEISAQHVVRGPNLFWEDEEAEKIGDGQADQPTTRPVIEFRETSPEEFERGIQQVDQTALDQDRNYDGSSRLFVSNDGVAGYAVSNDGEMKWVWSTKHGYGRAAVKALQRGARHLSAFDNGKLVQFYGGLGFKEQRRERNWTPGEPDVVFMERGDDGQQAEQPAAQPLPPGSSSGGSRTSFAR